MTRAEQNINDFKEKSISVVGLGRSGIAIARLANFIGAKVYIYDQSSSNTVQQNLKALNQLGIRGDFGDVKDVLYNNELIVISPGVPADSEIVLEAQKRNIKIIGEVEFASLFTNSPIVGVTGSNGKSTTVSVLHHMAQSDEINGVLAGNVGIAFSEKVLDELQNPDPKCVYIVEISSFQMEFIDSFHPYISIYLNISPDHLDRHGSFDNYFQSKLRLSENQTTTDYVIYNADDKKLAGAFVNSTAKKITFSSSNLDTNLYHINNSYFLNREYAKLTKLENIGLPGQHNLYNLLAAASGAHCLGISDDKIAEIIQSFKGIPHRLELVDNINGVKYFNDSKATNIDAVKVALESFNSPIILILGGLAKGNDFDDLKSYTNIKCVIAYGDAKELIHRELSDNFNVEIVELLKDATSLSSEFADIGDVVLLSPGCASFDQFDNFEDRGSKFTKWVKELSL